MLDYKTQYERYYGNVRKRAPGRVPKREVGFENLYGKRNREHKNLGEQVLRKFIWQLVGALLLLILLLGIKMIPIEGAKEAYIVSKEAIDKNFDINEAIMTINIPELEDYKETVLDYIDDFKSTVTGDKTLKNLIKEEYVTPLIGKYKNLEGENTGVVIVTGEEKDVIASFDGTVKEIKEDESGKHIIIDHGKGVETYYGLLSKVEIKEGDKIQKGQNIGRTGIVNSAEEKGIVYKIIYMGAEKDPVEFMNFSTLQSV